MAESSSCSESVSCVVDSELSFIDVECLVKDHVVNLNML